MAKAPPIAKPFVFEKSYTEVLLALKHQDDKLNRTLTALAFLTAAGVALFLSLENNVAEADRLRFEGDASVTAVMFIVFLGAVALGLLTALAAIGPGAALRFDDKPAKESLLYYGAIARDKAAWNKLYASTDRKLNVKLGKNYRDESWILSRRVEYKVARSRESGAFVQLAILALLLLGVFGAGSIDDTARWWIATALILIVLLLPFWELFQMQTYNKSENLSAQPYLWLGATVFLAAVLLSAGELRHEQHHWEALYYALLVLLTSRLAILSCRAAHGLLRITVVIGLTVLVGTFVW